jgi:hypothetical protein
MLAQFLHLYNVNLEKGEVKWIRRKEGLRCLIRSLSYSLS